MKIYLAARYSRLNELKYYCTELENIGYTVTSRWIKGNHQINDPNDIITQARFAKEDYEDILASDLLISFTEPPRKLNNSRGGRHVEYGIALALKKKIIIIGYRENVFHYLNEHYKSWKEAFEHISKL